MERTCWFCHGPAGWNAYCPVCQGELDPTRDTHETGVSFPPDRGEPTLTVVPRPVEAPS
jgi:hypothetical protein